MSSKKQTKKLVMSETWLDPEAGTVVPEHLKVEKEEAKEEPEDNAPEK